MHAISFFYTFTKGRDRKRTRSCILIRMEIFGKTYDIEKILVILIAAPFALVAVVYIVLLAVFSLFSI